MNDVQAQLRHELQARFVPFDGAQANAMIDIATQTSGGVVRYWTAPVAAAAAVVVIGGSAAGLAAGFTGGSSTPSGGSPTVSAPSGSRSVAHTTSVSSCHVVVVGPSGPATARPCVILPPLSTGH